MPAHDDPRIVAFGQLLDRVDALDRCNADEGRYDEIGEIVACLRELLVESGFDRLTKHRFNVAVAERLGHEINKDARQWGDVDVVPALNVHNPDELPGIHEGLAQVFIDILNPLLPGDIGIRVASDLLKVAAGDKPSFLGTRFEGAGVRGQPNSIQKADIRGRLILHAHYAAGLHGGSWQKYLHEWYPMLEYGFRKWNNNVLDVEKDAVRQAGKDKKAGREAAGLGAEIWEDQLARYSPEWLVELLARLK